MLGHNLFKNALAIPVTVDGTNYLLAAGTSDVNSGIVDTLGYKGIAWVVMLGAIAASGAVTVKAQQGAASNLSDAADLAGTSQGPTADTDDNKVIIVDIYRPQERYQRLAITRGDGGNSTINALFCILYNPDHANPVSQANAFGAEFFNSPAEGTA